MSGCCGYHGGSGSGSGSETGGECATCSDRADVVVIVSLEGRDAAVEFGDGTRGRAAVDLVEGVSVGDRVLVHQGVAIGRVLEEAR